MDKTIGAINKFIYIGIAVMILIIASDYFTKNNPSNEAQRHYENGRTLSRNFQYEQAILEYDAAIEIRPRFAEAYANRCFALEEVGRFDEALEDCDRALELDRSLTWVHNTKCAIYSDMNDIETAESVCERAIALNPNHASTHNVMGLLHSAKGEHEAAIERYTSALEIEPQNGIFFFNRGMEYLDIDHLDAAIADLEQATFHESNFDRGHINYITSLYRAQRYEEALVAANTMKIYFPNRPEVNVWITAINIAIGED